MPSNNVEELNDKFGIPDNLVFETDSDGLIYCLINNENSIAKIKSGSVKKRFDRINE